MNKREVIFWRRLLVSGRWSGCVKVIEKKASKRSATSLIGVLATGDIKARWRAAEALGRVVSRIAQQDRESAREVVRRLLWCLNEESGNMGWGVPEALGEVMSREPKLREEYLTLYGSFLGIDSWGSMHHDLRVGYLWGLSRLASAGATENLPPQVTSCARESLRIGPPMERGWAAVLLGQVKDTNAIPLLLELVGCRSTFLRYEEGEVYPASVGEVALASLSSIQGLTGEL